MADDTPLAIRVISDIVEKVLGSQKIDEVISAIRQILVFWNHIPPDLKKKTYFTFEKIWNRHFAIFSTKKEIPELFLTEKFSDPRIEKIWESATQKDASALILGITTKELINRAQHEQSKAVKENAYYRYGSRGLTISNIVTTDDIYLIADEIGSISDRNAIKQIFENWIENYMEIAILVEPGNIKNIDAIEKEILRATRSLKKNYLILNMCSNSPDTIQELINLVEKMKSDKKIKYESFEKNRIYESGFYLSFKGIIHF